MLQPNIDNYMDFGGAVRNGWWWIKSVFSRNLVVNRPSYGAGWATLIESPSVIALVLCICVCFFVFVISVYMAGWLFQKLFYFTENCGLRACHPVECSRGETLYDVRNTKLHFTVCMLCGNTAELFIIYMSDCETTTVRGLMTYVCQSFNPCFVFGSSIQFKFLIAVLHVLMSSIRHSHFD